MSVDKKILDRIEKLLKLGNPLSNDSVNERQNAAVEACKLIAQHDLVVRPREIPVKRKRQRPSAAQTVTPTWGAGTAPPPGWTRSFAARDSFCADPDCGGPITRGDRVWSKITGFDVTYIHIGEACGW